MARRSTPGEGHRRGARPPAGQRGVTYLVLLLAIALVSAVLAASATVWSPPGYVGYEEGGMLTDRIRRNPYCVLLFDEIEKAHRGLIKILLSIFDDGQASDAFGNLVDFKNTIIIMTSNVGSQWIQELGMRDRPEMERRVMDALRATFKPEFLNRIDEIIIFQNLTPEQIGAIVEIQLERLSRRLAERKIVLRLSDGAKQLLGRKGYDPVYGARPLKRAIQQFIENPLAMEILKGRFPEGSELLLDAEDERITFGRI